MTDALLVLGYIDPGHFLGGAVQLDLDSATAACARLGNEIGLDASQAAEGIRQIALAEMSKVVRSRLAQSGIALHETDLVSYGGSGSLFAPPLARDLGMRRVVVPPMTSVFSAFGAASADLRRERVALVDRLLPCESESVVSAIGSLIDAVIGDLRSDGVDDAHQSIDIYGEFRFYRQKWELTLPLDVDLADVQFDGTRAIDDFKTAYAHRYSEAALAVGAPVELVALRAVGTGQTVKVALEDLGAEAVARHQPASSRRLFQDSGGTRQVDCYHYESLAPGAPITGPALIDAVDTTIWVPNDMVATLERSGSLTIDLNRAEAA